MRACQCSERRTKQLDAWRAPTKPLANARTVQRTVTEATGTHGPRMRFSSGWPSPARRKLRNMESSRLLIPLCTGPQRAPRMTATLLLYFLHLGGTGGLLGLELCLLFGFALLCSNQSTHTQRARTHTRTHIYNAPLRSFFSLSAAVVLLLVLPLALLLLLAPVADKPVLDLRWRREPAITSLYRASRYSLIDSF